MYHLWKKKISECIRDIRNTYPVDIITTTVSSSRFRQLFFSSATFKIPNTIKIWEYRGIVLSKRQLCTIIIIIMRTKTTRVSQLGIPRPFIPSFSTKSNWNAWLVFPETNGSCANILRGRSLFVGERQLSAVGHIEATSGEQSMRGGCLFF